MKFKETSDFHRISVAALLVYVFKTKREDNIFLKMVESRKISRNRIMQVKWGWQDTEDRKKVSWQKGNSIICQRKWVYRLTIMTWLKILLALEKIHKTTSWSHESGHTFKKYLNYTAIYSIPSPGHSRPPWSPGVQRM